MGTRDYDRVLPRVRRRLPAAFQVEDRKLNEQLGHDMHAKTSAFVAAGQLNSGGAIVSMVDLAARSVPARAQTALNLLIRCIGQFGEPLNQETQPAALALVNAETRNSAGRAMDIAAQSAPFRGNNHGPGVLASIDSALDLELSRIDGEIKLMVAASKRQSKTESDRAQITVNGQVGMIQTGPGSYGVASINADASSHTTLLKALGDVEEALSKASDLPFDRDEVSELVAAAKSEL